MARLSVDDRRPCESCPGTHARNRVAPGCQHTDRNDPRPTCFVNHHPLEANSRPWPSDCTQLRCAATTEKRHDVPSAALLTRGDDRSPVLIHVPHASRIIPVELRPDLLLTDVELAAELDEATDTATDEIAAAALRHTRLKPTTVVNTFSRLVIGPKRFPDSSEPRPQ
ncbi:N-formylglutamate amidohydrolase [Rhodococcus sp. Rp3]|uniref:N-formylglutamate amidohydrolase n=1 Tax=Rhodococcus sp. Rp3 TaxID=2807635 RepID=UPI00233E631B|nr:N-formylglutamate amidohydrolase [Rhodococcus sp. Rp3]